MKEFKNLKIEVNAEQPLDEIVKELERLGYKRVYFDYIIPTMWIFTWRDGEYTNYCIPEVDPDEHDSTTLSELKEM